VNCAGVVCPESFPDDFKYLTLWLRDAKGENITSILYDVLEYIDQALINGGKVFVHCQQGVSRSSSMVIGYLMYKKDWGFTDTHSYVKKIRGVSNPNTGFTYQLLEWYKKLHSPMTKSRLYRIAPQSSDAPDLLVPKKQEDLVWSSLDHRGTFVLHSPECLYIWVGTQTTDPFIQAAQRFVKHLQKFEKATQRVQTIKQSQETEDFLKEMGFKVGEDGKVIGSDTLTLVNAVAMTQILKSPVFHRILGNLDLWLLNLTLILLQMMTMRLLTVTPIQIRKRKTMMMNLRMRMKRF